LRNNELETQAGLEEQNAQKSRIEGLTKEKQRLEQDVGLAQQGRVLAEKKLMLLNAELQKLSGQASMAAALASDKTTLELRLCELEPEVQTTLDPRP